MNPGVPAGQVQHFRCINVQCRIVIFIGTNILPFNGCPVCMTSGIIVAQKEGT